MILLIKWASKIRYIFLAQLIRYPLVSFMIARQSLSNLCEERSNFSFRIKRRVILCLLCISVCCVINKLLAGYFLWHSLVMYLEDIYTVLGSLVISVSFQIIESSGLCWVHLFEISLPWFL